MKVFVSHWVVRYVLIKDKPPLRPTCFTLIVYCRAIDSPKGIDTNSITVERNTLIYDCIEQ